MFIRFLGIAMLTSMLLMIGCGGGGARSNQSITSTTRGQELLDLKRAYDQGVISQREYNDQKERILDKD